MKLNLFILFIFIVLSKEALSQQKETKLILTGRAFENAIMLRWAPDDHIGWQLANKYGYRLERVTLLKDGEVLATPERVIINHEPIKPLPLDDWEPLVLQHEEYAAIAAQALYGESFNIYNDLEGDLMQIVNKVKEDEARYSFALFSADQSIEVADALGLFFKDETARNNEKYVYKISLWETVNNIAIEPGSIYIGLEDHQPLPVPVSLEAEFGDKQVSLSWPAYLYSGTFNNYILERSDDGGENFTRRNQQPFAFTEDNDNVPNKYYTVIDSLPDNEREYFYRIRGLNIFGEISEPSDPVAGKGKSIITGRPEIISTHVVDEKKVKIVWKFPEEHLSEIEGFKVLRTSSMQQPYIGISTMGKTSFEFWDSPSFSSNYYIVRAFNANGDYVNSFPALVQLKDSIPPAKPLGLKAEVDPFGVVSIQWEKNKEDDLLGYRIYSSNFKSSEFYQLNKGYLTDNNFLDTLNLKTLSEKSYYKVVAIDYHLNASDFSNVLEVKRPDIVPPVPPVFKNIQSSEKGIKLFWVNSTSNDVKRHVLFRRQQGEQLWVTLEIFENLENNFFDEDCEPNQTYHYIMVAIDDSGLESPPSKPLIGKRVSRSLKPAVKDIHIRPVREQGHIELLWQYSEENVKNFKIYRADGETALRHIAEVINSEFAFKDKGIMQNSKYKYRIKAIFEDGSESMFSKEISVKY